jgi:hypothetical protein
MDKIALEGASPEALAFALGVAISAAGIRSFKTQRLLATVSPTCELTHAWLGYAALTPEGNWLFDRFAPANGGTIPAGIETTFAVDVEVEDLAGCYDGRKYAHTTVLLGVCEGGVAIAFDSLSRGVAASDILSGDGALRFADMLRAGNAVGMHTILANKRFVTPAADGVLVCFTSGMPFGSVRIETALETPPAPRHGMDAIGVFPRRGF